MIPHISSQHWASVGFCHHHGINVFLPSLKTINSPTGRFGSLELLLPWIKSIGFDTLQLLPLNDSDTDPSPYNCLSSHALHPKYIEEGPLPPEEGLTAFMEEEHWVIPYSLFKALKEKNGGAAFWLWPQKEQHYSEALFTTYEKEALVHIKNQYIAHFQLKRLKEEAGRLGILLLGDLPILISPDSADVWYEPHLFNNSFAVGAPPDIYNTEGQYWGFPLPRFDAMEKEKFHWWKTRLKTASSYYHMYRIDHTVGFFRLFAIPKGEKATQGFFVPGDEPSWIYQGKNLLKGLLESSPLLPIAEDLGVIPQSVRDTLLDYGIPGTKVPRWERLWDLPGAPLIPPKSYTPYSLTTVSTHDSETLGAWWHLEHAAGLDPTTRFALLKESHTSGSLFHINLLGEYLALFDDLVYNEEDKERINIPGKILPTNWRYRTKPFLEEIIAHKGLQQAMKNLLC